MSDILNKIDTVLNKVHGTGFYIKKQNAINIMEYIIKDVPDDKILLEAFKRIIDSEWSYTNTSLIEDFKCILEQYGVIGNSIHRKMILEVNKNKIVRSFIKLKHIEEIKALL
jgi:hypothetical protein